MLSVVVIDDELLALNLLTYLLDNFTSVQLKVVGKAMNLKDGIELIKHTNPDIVFLDIEMPDGNGMEIFDHQFSQKTKIVLVTGHENYAVEAINKSVAGYLLKPVNIVDLQEVIKRIDKMIRLEQQHLELEDRINILGTSEVPGKNLIFDVESGFIVENTKNIEYCTADQSYATIVTHAKREFIVSKSLKELEAYLPQNQFYRTHKSYLVNIYYIRKFVRSGESYVLLKSGMKIPVSVRKTSLIFNEIKEMLSNDQTTS
jgi:two-component system, LytTR family, response regulator